MTRAGWWLLAVATPPHAAKARDAAPPQVPPAASAPAHQAGRAPHAMVAAANPLAVAAALAVLRRGGDAVDAAVAAQAVLGLVEPQSSGLGGGAFLLYYDARTHGVTAYNGRETAPAGADPRQFVAPNGHPRDFGSAVLGGISTGVPGAIAMLDVAQHEHGRLAWRSLFGAARALAEKGFTVSPRLASMITSGAPETAAPDVIAYFTHADGRPYRAGDVLKNPAYARTLDALAAGRAGALLSGPIAADIVARVGAAPLPSTMTLADLSHYHPLEAPALCRPYRAVVVCTPGAPSGGVPLQEALGLLDRTAAIRGGANDAGAWAALAEASRLAYADRDRYEGDPDFVTVPVAGLLSPGYLDARAALIGPSAAPVVSAGVPPGAPARGPDATAEPGGTSHLVIADRWGNVVSMTTTVESIFGSGRMVDGFFLNNQLTDFSFTPRDMDGTPAANAVAPAKRPRSSMAPVIILAPDGRFRAALGSPGGSSIIAYNLKGVVGMIDWHLAPQQVAALPNLVAHGRSFTADVFPPALADALAARGLPLDSARGENSGLQVVVKDASGYSGGADPRREGAARGF